MIILLKFLLCLFVIGIIFLIVTGLILLFLACLTVIDEKEIWGNDISLDEAWKMMNQDLHL